MRILTTAQASQYGNQAIADFHNEMLGKFNEQYELSLEELKRIVIEGNPDFLSEVGQALYHAGFGLRRSKESMERVVDKMNDPYAIPGAQAWIMGIREELESFDFAILGDVGISIAQDVVEKGQEAGIKLAETGKTLFDASIQGSIDLLKNSKYLLGLLAIIGLAYAANSYRGLKTSAGF